MKIFFLLVVALILTSVFGFQLLSRFDHLPDGNRIVLIGQHIAFAAISIGAIAALFLLAKANRNFTSYLKAFVILAAMACLGQCAPWYSKFNGPSHWVSSKAGEVHVQVPSNWARNDELSPASDLFVVDWAGTRSVAITLGQEFGGIDLQTEIDAVGQTLREHMAPAFGQPIDSVSCGDLCVGDVFYAVSIGKPMHAVSVAKAACGRLMLVQSTYMVSASENASEINEKRQEAIRIIQAASCSANSAAVLR